MGFIYEYPQGAASLNPMDRTMFLCEVSLTQPELY